MYAVGINNLGQHGTCIAIGNNGLQKLHNTTRRGWLRETEVMRNTVDMVYIVSDFTQKMCEMSQSELADYIDATCITRLK